MQPLNRRAESICETPRPGLFPGQLAKTVGLSGCPQGAGASGDWAGQGEDRLELAALSSNLCSATYWQGDFSEPQFPHLLNGNNQAT